MPASTPIDRERFLQELTRRFPEAAESISELEAGLLHPEMSVVSRATREAINASYWHVVEAHFAFISELFSGGTEELRNAIYVSYLENVLLGETEPHFVRARTMLPQALGQAMIELEAHFKRLSSASRTGA